MNVLYSADIRNIESAAASGGLTYERMMENAGSAAAGVICEKYDIKDKTAVIIAGSGNNGGDGFVVARKLHEAGAKVFVILVCGLPKTETAHACLIKLSQYPIRILNSFDDGAEELAASADFIIDAVFGIGFHGEMTGDAEKFCGIANRSAAVKIALDLPSGCGCDDGSACGSTFFAELTVTFIAVKPCHVLYPASDYCGKTVLVGIGVPRRIIAETDSNIEIITPQLVKKALPVLTKNSHKGSCGSVAQLCGSYGMAGAAVLSARGAQACGAGLVKCILPQSIYPIVATNVIEAVYTVLSGNGEQEDIAAASASLSSADSCLIGCGLGNNESSEKFFKALLPLIKKPTVIDADGINILARNINILCECKAQLVLTPHPAEMGRLIGADAAAVQVNRFAVARAVAQKLGAVIVLKGANTVVALPSGKLFVAVNGNPGMATAGSGDVLAGVIASLLAQGVNPENAAVAGVYIHAAAGDVAAEKLSPRSVTASDIAENIGNVFLQLE